MSVAEVVSMAMAELLIVVLKMVRRHGRTYVVGDKPIASSLFLEV